MAIRGETIRLGQLLKLAGAIASGSDARPLLASGAIRVNGASETRRGRQLHGGDVIELPGRALRVVSSGSQSDPAPSR